LSELKAFMGDYQLIMIYRIMRIYINVVDMDSKLWI